MNAKMHVRHFALLNDDDDDDDDGGGGGVKR